MHQTGLGLWTGRTRQYATFLVCSLLVVTASVLAYPHVRRASLLVATSERLIAQDRTAEALAALREAMSLGRVPVTKADAMLKAALKAGEGDIAGQMALLLMEKGRPVESGLVGRAAGLLDAAGNAGAALALLEKRRSMGPLERQETLHLGDLLRRQNRFESALSVYDAFLKTNPDDTAALADRSETYLWMGRPEEAERTAREMLARKPDSRAARLVLARSLAVGGKAEAAIAEYKKLLGDTP